MRSVTMSFVAFGLLISVSLSACMDGTDSMTARDSAPARSGQSGERDVEDPETFSRRENALWDGRPSLGGVWVAHPDATSPERVIIRNTENNRETIGALFRRERMNPGPAFQVSGEAANAIGILAGAPTEIEVVALRTEQEQAEPEPEMADAEEPREAEPDTVAESDAVDVSEARTDDATDAVAADAPRREGGFLSRLFRRSPRDDAGREEIETELLDDDALATAPPAEEAPPAPAPQQPPAPAPSTLERPYIQLGIFSVEENARNASNMAGDAGLSANIVEGQTQGNAFWRVVVGPAGNAAELQELLAQVKALGFSDAYSVRR